ncbi:hypothetical protein QJS04_geneDACA008819 [Acorus gramineus]|uniref:RRM domain-containing protein n=1 Tax=Acorus gramineus TaxID=55184 RepID=A0AAV9AE70_ACOGR|nr:hypothetical protein QJS04_geneDACA008819 [Acorus gramineus]
MELAATAAFLVSPAAKPRISLYTLRLSPNIPSCPLHLKLSNSKKSLHFQLFSAVDQGTVAVDDRQAETVSEETQIESKEEKRRKLYVFNLPWSFSAEDIKNLFGQCGSVRDVEIIRQKNGLSRGYAFITMSSSEEALAAIEKFDSFELQERIIRVEFAKNFKKPTPPPPPGIPVSETRYKIYVSNLAWKARSGTLREFFSTSCKPVSVKVVFDGPSGRSAGYGFVSFATQEEADAAISALDGKEFMGRPLRLRIGQKTADESQSETKEENELEGQAEDA